VALGRELRHPDSHAFALSLHSKLDGYRGEWVKCREAADAGLEIAVDSGSAQALAWNHCMRGWAIAHLGQIEEGLTELEAGLDASERIMGKVAFSQLAAMAAQVHLLRGDVSGADAWLARALSFMESHDDRFFESEVYRLSAQCLARNGQPGAARARLEQAVDLARAQGARTLELFAGVDLAGLDPEAGAIALRTVLAAFPEPEPWPIVEQARRIVRHADQANVEPPAADG
jgi:predicted ATPase